MQVNTGMRSIPDSKSTWLIVGASRGIGREFVRQLLAKGHVHVICALRSAPHALEESLENEAVGPEATYLVGPGTCDVSREEDIVSFVEALAKITRRIDHVVLNAGILDYPNHAIEASFTSLQQHMSTNALGPTFMAGRLLSKSEALSIDSIIFMSSDSGSMGQFTGGLEDGFAAYAASKAALNMFVRHVGQEVLRRDLPTKIIALHPGEVLTDMASNVELPWEVQGTMTAMQSVGQMIKLIRSSAETPRSSEGAIFLDWDGKQRSW